MCYVTKHNNVVILTGGDVAHLLSQARLLHCCHGVTATNDGGGALGGQLSQGLGNGLLCYVTIVTAKVTVAGAAGAEGKA
jgi:hypothetical protein